MHFVSVLDTAIYGLIGPFAVLHVFPRYFLNLEREFGMEGNATLLVQTCGVVLMHAGALLAGWCAVLMWRNKRGSVSPLSRPTGLVTMGPYRIVRHPMMWALNIVLIGEILVHGSWLLLAWFATWLRFAAVYIRSYEEPYLQAVFGQPYLDYCETTPRWWPTALKRMLPIQD